MEKLVFMPNEEDLRAAYRLHLKQSGWKKLGFFVLFGILMGVALAAIDGFSSPPQTAGLVAAMGLWAAIVAGIIRFLIPIFWVPRLAKKIYRQQKDLQLETETWWDEEQLHSKNAQGHAYLKLIDMVKWRSDENIMLLYRSDNLFNFIPMRVFNDRSQFDALKRRFIDAGIPDE